MELRVRGERAVLGEEVDPHNVAIGADLADALHEWARVAAAVRRANGDREAAAVVSQRGRQLAGRVAEVMGTTVYYVDPVTDAGSVIPPPDALVRKPVRPEEPTPWATGLTVAAFVGVVVFVAMLALARTLAAETSGLLAFVAAVLVSAGLAPSLWLGRKLPILRWVVLGAAAGIAFSWIGVLAVVFA
ncbi:DUF2537 domain-containing protein [Amycolatopsis sp. 195334CR]|uniref:DUF2537 domain-containing protein n=1 Tax=Amycolatopsis sp. 195334CR TaxID=2814588 RepID=UPI001A90C065|nr:DUF2537 domain-containing protein [Amycolatopsis sp. 195334CR]MBN6034871.1 DUF2537 domain-containing protein [Amycolatopsis sp. 195334CR]